MVPSIGADGELLPFYESILWWWFSFTICYATKWRTISVEFCASLRLLYFISVFCSLLINTRLVFISYFVSVPLRRGYRGSRISVFVCTCFFLHFWLFVLRLLVFRRLFCNISFYHSHSKAIGVNQSTLLCFVKKIDYSSL